MDDDEIWLIENDWKLIDWKWLKMIENWLIENDWKLIDWKWLKIDWLKMIENWLKITSFVAVEGLAIVLLVLI